MAENQNPTINANVPTWKLEKLVCISDLRRRTEHAKALHLELERRRAAVRCEQRRAA